VNCQHCAALVELLMVELDGSLHTCPGHILARVRRQVVDEQWWERMQSPADVPEIIEDPPPRAVSNPPGRERYLGEL
jgi:hypothetical protein